MMEERVNEKEEDPHQTMTWRAREENQCNEMIIKEAENKRNKAHLRVQVVH